jgi:hypothetical protein
MRKTLDAGDLVEVAGGLGVVSIGAREIVECRIASRRCGAGMVLMIQELQLHS